MSPEGDGERWWLGWIRAGLGLWSSVGMALGIGALATVMAAMAQ